MPDDFTPSQQAAAFHGLASNPTVPMDERLAMALQALDIYEAEAENLRAEGYRKAIADLRGHAEGQVGRLRVEAHRAADFLESRVAPDA